jgi:hypothetical protein
VPKAGAQLAHGPIVLTPGLRTPRDQTVTVSRHPVATRLHDLFTGAEPDVHAVDAAWTANEPTVADRENEPRAEQAKT